MDIKTKIMKMRNIKENSVNSYITSLKKIYGALESKVEFDSLSWLDNINRVVDILNKLKLTTRKNYCNSIIVALLTNPEKHEKLLAAYRKYLDVIVEEFNNTMKSQEKSDKMEANWVSMAQLKKMVARHKRTITENGLNTKSNWTNGDLQLYQMYLVGILYTETPPLRNDYSNMKVISESEFEKLDNTNQNYLVVVSRNRKYFSLGSYKTDGKYGTKKINIDSKVNTIINKWLAHNASGWFLVNIRGGPLSDNSLTKLLNKIFSSSNKKISSTMIRHIYLSEKYKGVQTEMDDDANAMGHSVHTQQNIYVKK
jgi:integrase